jgi:murein endopeptidase
MTASREAQQRVDDALNAAIAKAGDRRMIENLGVQIAMQVLGTATDLSGETTVPSTLCETFIEGDTWNSFASRYGLTTEALARLNPGISGGRVDDGDELIIYKFDPERRSRSVGRASGGGLANGVPMPDGQFWRVRERETSFGTETTINELVAALAHVGNELPGGTRVIIGDLSRPQGRPLSPHLSHQSGRDADVGYYLRGVGPQRAFDAASRSTLDVARQWAQIRFLLERGTVERIFMDYSLQIPLVQYARRIGEDPAYLARVFEYGGEGDIITHSPGHRDHIHIRFRCDAWDKACKQHEETEALKPPPIVQRVSSVENGRN